MHAFSAVLFEALYRYQHLQFRVDPSLAPSDSSQGDDFHLRTNQNQRTMLPARPELEGGGMCIKSVNSDY